MPKLTMNGKPFAKASTLDVIIEVEKQVNRAKEYELMGKGEAAIKARDYLEAIKDFYRE